MKHSFTFLTALLVLALPAAAQAATNRTPSVTGTAKRPNIVLIMADDLGYGSLGCYGSPTIKTPQIDQLAASGVRFTDFHSSGTVCSPTRAALLTGRYPQRCTWVPDEQLSPVFREQRAANPSQRWAWGISPQEITLPAVLRPAGYRTALIGKWHLGYDFAFHPLNYGFDEFRGFVGGNVDYHTHVAGYGQKQLDWWNGKKIENEEGYTTDLLTKYAVDFIARNKDAPFFLYLAHAAPHDPWQGRDPAQKKSPAEIYREMIEGLDTSVGAVAAALRTHGLERTTLLIFCSDNGGAAPRGFPANAPLPGRKGSMEEGGHRVPFIASWPGIIPAGTTTAATVITMDIFPTLARLAQATIPDGHRLDGTDILPLLQAPSLRPARTLHWLFGDDWAVRQGAWKLTGRGPDAVSLVNLDEDPEEKRNERIAQPERTRQLEALHRQWLADVGPR
jgi:arylsulfatase A-like enzyme